MAVSAGVFMAILVMGLALIAVYVWVDIPTYGGKVALVVIGGLFASGSTFKLLTMKKTRETNEIDE
ncbi:hypothetical protein PC129_g14832 [Phytophthora cactorum]|uniref:Uncharacterized protein n=1 Tax=Phytophthora cactorum TaxID=29920 RepID=A0A329RTL7_9STRA|nr:hypothetical protein Pcac1_g28568 [Phytophthora cactorum]KAG2809460.1 hypothetical protein PC112_g16489 [Phytophthora cactorum]KAG2811093.1 hypothetical protein PC111_g15368 [Phytophthora cactorum]KAG2850752.1 hypothetical protein PC113_g16515 [Phytophthora cactorum]KAG2889304.1 hypothetical protein PC114_g18007 [Phytophthora cactorum]